MTITNFVPAAGSRWDVLRGGREERGRRDLRRAARLVPVTQSVARCEWTDAFSQLSGASSLQFDHNKATTHSLPGYSEIYTHKKKKKGKRENMAL